MSRKITSFIFGMVETLTHVEIFSFLCSKNDFDDGRKISVLENAKNSQMKKTLKMKRATLKTSRFLRKQEIGRLILVIEK